MANEPRPPLPVTHLPERPDATRAATAAVGLQQASSSIRRSSFSMSTDPLLRARREARGEAILFVVVTMALLTGLAVTSLLAGWELIGLPGWVWLALCVPEAVLIGGLFLSAQVGDDERHHRWLQRLLALGVIGNLIGLLVLVAGLLTEKSSDLPGAHCSRAGWSSG